MSKRRPALPLGVRAVEFEGPIGRDPERAGAVVRSLLEAAAKSDLKLIAIHIEPDRMQVQMDIPPHVEFAGTTSAYVQGMAQILHKAFERGALGIMRDGSLKVV